MAKYNCNNILFIISILLFFPNFTASDNSPMDIIRESNESILHIYQTLPPGDGRLSEEILAIMEKVTDFDTMANRAVEHVCTQEDNESCNQLKNEFIQLLKLNATRKLGRYRADRFDYIGVESTAERVTAKTVAYYGKESLEIDYILEKRDSQWRVVNFIVDGIDTIQNYQKQFNRITRKKSLAFLTKRLKMKNELFLKESKEQNNTQ